MIEHQLFQFDLHRDLYIAKNQKLCQIRNFKREVDMKYEPENLKHLTVTSSGTSVVQSAAGRAMQNRKSAADSTLNSLECWDYSVELECLRGPDGKFTI